jgi:hypothetical protein
MSSALTVLIGIAYIALSIFFKFTPRLRVIAGLVVGSLLAGLVATWINKWVAKGVTAVSGPIGRWIGQSTHAVEIALPSALAFILAVIVIVHLKGKKGGAGGKGGAGKGGGGGKASLAHIALGCAVVLPVIAGSVNELVRSVTR